MDIQGRYDTSEESEVESKIQKKDFKCKVDGCSFKTKWRSSLSRHLRTHDISRMFKCIQCPCKFAEKFRLKDHERAKHGDGLMCAHCSKLFLSREGLRAHMMTVMGTFRYRCDICDKTFLNKSHFDGHMNKHRNYKPYRCQLCKKGFAYSCTFNEHRLRCGQDKTYDCDLCDKKFVCSRSLRKHKKGKHSGNFKRCEVCGKEYNWEASYYRHIKRHI